MQISFKISIPDQPYHKEFKKQNEITITYYGDRYLYVCINPTTNKILRIVRSKEHIDDDFPFSDYEKDDEAVFLIDAEKHPIYAAILTGKIEFPEGIKYKEKLVDGSEWTYRYQAMWDIFYLGDIKYYPETDEFSTLTYLEHSISKEDYINGHNVLISELQEQSQNSSDDEIKKIIEAQILIAQERFQLFQHTDHWKIPPLPFLEMAENQDQTAEN